MTCTQSADGELLLWSVGEGGAGLVDGREGRDVNWATHTVTGAMHCICAPYAVFVTATLMPY